MLTHDEHDGRLFMLHPHEFEWEEVDGGWIAEKVWSDNTEEAINEARAAANIFGTGRFRFYGSCYGRDMWTDENGRLHVTKSGWNRVGNDFKGTYSDFRGDHPELRGRKTIMPPLELGFSTCLLIEGSSFVMEV